MRFAAIFLLSFYGVSAQTPQVPHKMNFAGITLTIRDDARREIQKDVDALTQAPKYFNIKVERARTYFPIIEKIFAEERLPDDFKYLVLQESALIADAVSVSNAVGFWQFKDFTAVEMGLRVDKEIDERMNIASSSRAAAQYLKKNNHFFNNWIYALQAYQMGAGGVMRSISDYESGARHMEITSQTYWYVKKFLAHKVAFESAIKGPAMINVVAYENTGKKSLSEIAKEVSLPAEQLESYNKWVRKGIIPDDRKYIVAIPVQGDSREIYASVAKATAQKLKEAEHPKRLEARPAQAIVSDKKFIHGLPTIKAVQGESPAALAKRANIGLSTFLSYNDLSISDQLIEEQYYYLKRKKARAAVAQHTVMLSQESLWSVSQQYGVQLKRIKKLNPSLSTSTLKSGTTVKLPALPGSASRTEDVQVAAVEVESDDFFTWSVDPKSQAASLVTEVKPEARPVVQLSEPTVVSKPQETSVSEAKKPSGSGQHVVVQGETLYSIAKLYSVGVMDLVNWNQLKMEEGIRPGQVLRSKEVIAETANVLPQSDTTESFIVYEIKSSDTLYSVARQYGVTIKDLMDWNKKKDFNVTVGEKLKIQQK
jgi:membrane-bound lytic murein transglycosylase D